jgi:DNA modification methylase
LKKKDLTGIPWSVAFALRSKGWYLRQEIIRHKPNPMPESVRDRYTKSHESLFLFAKQSKYYFDNESIMEPAMYDG